MKHIVVLGAGYAGMMTALRLSHTTRKTDNIQITLVNAGETFVERIRLHEVATGHAPTPNRIEDLIRGTGIQFIQGWVTEIHPNQKAVEVHHGDSAETLHYDKLVYALGSMVDRDSVQGVRDHAYTLDADSAPLLSSRLQSLAEQQGKVIVIGGGLTGIETATEIAETYPNLKVTMLTHGKVGQYLSQKAQDHIQKTFTKMGILVRDGITIAEVCADGVRLKSGEFVPAGAVIWSAGFKPVPLAKDSGFATNTNGQMIVDSTLRSISHPDVYAAGDSMNFESGALLQHRMSCQLAMPLGCHVADNLTRWIEGSQPKDFRFGYAVQCISLGQRRGLVQMINPDDSVKESILTGFIGWLTKRGILKMTLWAIKMERTMHRAYVYPKSIRLGKANTSQQRLVEAN